MPTDILTIRDLEVACVVGAYTHERGMPQRLIVDAELRVDTEAAARSESLSDCLDYDATCAQMVFLLQSCRFQLLETAAHALMSNLLLPPAPDEERARVASARITLTKPAALEGRAVPSLTIERDASWLKLGHEVKPFGTVDVIYETRQLGIYRLNVAPGRTIPMHEHRVMRESELVLGEGLLCQGRPAPVGTVRHWPKGAAHDYVNPTARHQSILCVDSPPFVPDDEVEVDRPPDLVDPEPPWRLGWALRTRLRRDA